MKIRTLTLGEYGSPPTPFCLYLFPTPLTPPLTSPPFSSDKDAHFHFLCLEDLDALFFSTNDNYNRNSKRLLATMYEQHPAWFCKDQSTGRSYLMTQAVGTIANNLNVDSLATLCRLTEEELLNGKATELLRHHAKLRTSAAPISSSSSSSSASAITQQEQEFVPTRLLDGHERFQSTVTAMAEADSEAAASIKQEPHSPVIRLSPPSGETIPYDPCRDDVADTAGNRLSSMPRSPPQDVHTTMTDPHLQLPKPSSLLLKRSAGQQHHKAPTNLTIFTPSYARNGDATSIRSAPLHPRASKQNSGLLQQRHQQHTQHRVSKVVSSNNNSNNSTASSILKKRAQPPATAAPWQRQAPQTEFPSPPIVPSQQRCPPQYLRTAAFPKTPMTNPPHLHSLHQQHTQQQQQHPHPHHPQQQPPMTAAIMPVPSSTPAISKKQQFLQPFEMLYDNIEQTRQLKSTLDDHIRRSSSLIQTLQSSSSMVEALVRRNVREAMQQQLQEYSNRVEWLEKRMLSSSSSTRANQSTSRSRSSSSNADHDTDTMMGSSSSSSPPSSQVGRVLSELVDRLDRLESKMDARSN